MSRKLLTLHFGGKLISADGRWKGMNEAGLILVPRVRSLVLLERAILQLRKDPKLVGELQ